MLTRLKRALFRNRRRAVITFCLFTVFGMLNSFPVGGSLHVANLAFVAFGTGIIMTALLMAGAVIMPKWRAVAEVAGMASVTFAALKLAVPGLEAALSPTLQLVAIWGLCVLIGSLYAGPRLDEQTMRPAIEITATATSRLPVDRIWTGLYGLPHQRDARHDRDMILSFDPVEGAPQSFRLVERADDVTQIEELQEMELRDPPHNIRFRWSVPSAPPRTPLATGTHTASLMQTKRGGTKITTNYSADLMSARMAVFAWADDHFGRVTDEKLARLESMGRVT